MIIIPRYQVFVKFVDVPSLDESEIGKMAEFQAIKEIPHPKDELIISFRNLGSYKEGFSSLMLTVATRDMIEERISKEVSPDAIRLHSELLYLFLLKEKIVDQDKVNLVIHAGKEDSEIMIIDKSRPVFSRGFKNNQALLDEIERSIMGYKRDKANPEIENIITVYPSGMNIEDIKKEIQGHFTIPVSFQEYSDSLMLMDIQSQIDLIPKEISHKRTSLTKKRESIITYSLIGVLVILFSTSFYLKMHEKRKVIDAFSTKLTEVESRIKGLDGFLKKTEAVKGHLEKGGFIIKVLEDFHLAVPQDISISGLDYDGKDNIFYKGNSKAMSAVLNYTTRLENSRYFSKVEVKYAAKKKVKGEEIVDFNLRCQLKP